MAQAKKQAAGKDAGKAAGRSFQKKRTNPGSVKAQGSAAGAGGNAKGAAAGKSATGASAQRTGRRGRAPDPRPVGVVDIGSNSIRLVVYSGSARTPIPVFNEKATCALGEKLQSTGRLSPEGVAMALPALGRFAALAKGLNVKRLDVLATSAVRDATDGPDFVARVRQETGLEVQVLTGDGEARRSASGVLCAIPDAEGLVADLGGGSLELARVSGGKILSTATLPLGLLRLQEIASGSTAKGIEHAAALLAEVPWLPECAGRDLYAVGGAWRAVARVCIEQRQHPLHVLDNYRMDADEAEPLLAAIGRLSQVSLSRISTVPRKRLPTLNLAALLLRRVLEVSGAEELIYSVYGMREGQFFRGLPRGLADRHPVIAAAEDIAENAGRSVALGHELMAWMDPLFPGETPRARDLRLAACLIGDAFWQEHPDYRAEQAMFRVLRLPFMGLEHTDRAQLALAIFHRYRGRQTDEVERIVGQLLDPETVSRAVTIGLALRLGLPLSGGVPGIVARTELVPTKGDLTLRMPAGEAVFAVGPMERRLSRLVQHLGLKGQVVHV